MNDGVTIWVSDANDSYSKRYPAMVSCLDNADSGVVIYAGLNDKWEYRKNSTDSTSIRWIWF